MTRVFFLPLLSRKFDDQLSSNFHRFVVLCICWYTPSEKTGFWQLPEVSSVFNGDTTTPSWTFLSVIQSNAIHIGSAKYLRLCFVGLNVDTVQGGDIVEKTVKILQIDWDMTVLWWYGLWNAYLEAGIFDIPIYIAYWVAWLHTVAQFYCGLNWNGCRLRSFTLANGVAVSLDVPGFFCKGFLNLIVEVSHFDVSVCYRVNCSR